MTGSPGYSWEKTYLAVRSLACGQGDLRERLHTAWWSHLTGLRAHPIPWPELQTKLDEIGARLVPEVSTGADSSRHMGNDELGKIAGDIVDLFNRVCDRKAAEDVRHRSN
jgi:hypothetical protein